MKKVAISFLLAVCIYSSQTATAQNKLRVEKEPSWVTVNSINYNNSTLLTEAEDGYFDLDYEKQVNVQEQASYCRKALKIITEAGVENKSEIAIDFDPSYQQVILHNISVIRDGAVINKLQLQKFKTIQQETDLKMHTYNGKLTSLLLLEDVRKGDVINYSYTVKGWNPIFNNRYTDLFQTQFGVPLGNLYYKVVTPANRNLNIKEPIAPSHPVITKTNVATTYQWKLDNVSALHTESKLPSWFDPFPSVLISEYNSWAEVSKWATTLFPPNISLSAELQNKINSIRKTNTTNEARALAALHFVQDDVRYMGIEMGTQSHKPTNPNKIFAQRFGDCKDKSYLLTTMLRAMEIEATPVLINTIAKRTINSYLPSPGVFDHCTVRIKIDGAFYYVDPTISLQRGSLKDLPYPDYQTGLVITDTTSALTFIPFNEKGKVYVREVFTIPDMSGLARLKVITTQTGYFADNVRSDFSNNSTFEMKKKYKNFYAYYFEDITADSLTYSNDDKTGEFTTTEYYTLNNIWKAENKVSKSYFSAFMISSVMTKPADQKRTMPFSLMYPARYIEDVEINLPEAWPVNDKKFKVECGWFRFDQSTTYDNQKLVYHFEFETLKDHVQPEEMEVYVNNYKQVEDNSSYYLSSSDNGAAAATPLITAGSPGRIFPKLYALLGVCVLITIAAKRRKQE